MITTAATSVYFTFAVLFTVRTFENKGVHPLPFNTMRLPKLVHTNFRNVLVELLHFQHIRLEVTCCWMLDSKKLTKQSSRLKTKPN